MRLRRTFAVGALAVGAIVATTAFAFPSVPVDKSQPLPALTAQALSARYAADSRMLAQAARSAEVARPAEAPPGEAQGATAPLSAK